MRGVAIAVVVLFHFPTRRVFTGGLFGVDLFFVLSGFLITPMLMEEFDRLGRVRLGDFLRRRAQRLLPALVAFVAVMLAATAIFGHRGWFTSNPFAPVGPGSPLSVGAVLKGAGAAATYTYNVFLAFHQPVPAPFGHLWTLAIEGQFYVLWALVLSRLLRRGPRVMAAATAAAIAVSAVSPFLAWNNGRGQTWIYFATAPRIQQLLGGALLARLWSLGLLQRVPAWVWKATASLGAAALCYLIFAVANVRFKYLGALSVAATAGILIIAHLVDGRATSIGKRLLASDPLVWLGRRSYSIYLWHWPLAEWTNQLPDPIGIPLGLGCSLMAAELSWRLVEAPAQRWFAGRRSPNSTSWRDPVPTR